MTAELLQGDNQYDTSSGGFGRQDANKGSVFTRLPPVLTLLLKRFDFDPRVMNFVKIHDRYEFPVRINLDRFVDPRQSDGEPVKNDYLLHSVLVHSVSLLPYMFRLCLRIITLSLLTD